MRNKDKLPAKNNKIKRAIWMFLASIGIASSIPNSTIASSNQNVNIEKDVEDKSKDDFFNSLKVNMPRQHIDNYKEKALEVVKEKDFNSVYEGGNEKVQKNVIKLFNKIEENTPRYASLHGIKNTKQYTEEEKKFVYTQIKDWPNNIIIPQGKYNKEDPNWKKLPIGISGLTKRDNKEILLRDKEDAYIALNHELCHSAQIKYKVSEYLPNYNAVIKKIKEGMSVDYEKKVRDLGDNTTNYAKEYISYKTLNFFTEGKTEKLLKGELEEETFLYDILSENLDKEDCIKFYTLIANVCRFGSNKMYGIGETLKENEERQQNIINKIEETRVDESLSQSEKDNIIEQLNCYLKCNKEYYNNLKENGNSVSKEGKSILNEDLKQLNKLGLELLKRDFNKISSRKDAQKALVNWNLYKKTCVIMKPLKDREMEDNTRNYVPKVKEVQDFLFKKCKETKLLKEDIGKEIFTAVLDSDINDISNVTIVKQKNKLVVMDQYAINTLKEEPNNNLLGAIEDKGKNIDEKSNKNKVKNKEKNYTLVSVGNYAKEFAQEIKGEHMDFIDEERLQER